MQIITIGNNNALSSLVTVKFNELWNWRELNGKQKPLGSSKRRIRTYVVRDAGFDCNAKKFGFTRRDHETPELKLRVSDEFNYLIGEACHV